MKIRKKIAEHLQEITNSQIIDNIILLQKDGYPIQANGVWVSKLEVFELCNAVSLLYYFSHRILESSTRVSIKSDGRKFIITSLSYILQDFDLLDKNKKELDKGEKNRYLMVFTLKDKNLPLREVFRNIKDEVTKIWNLLRTTDNRIKNIQPRLTDDQIQEVLKGFDIKNNSNQVEQINKARLTRKMDDLYNLITYYPNFKQISVFYQGKLVYSKLDKERTSQNNLKDSENSEKYLRIFQNALKVSWILKRVNPEIIILDSENYYGLISGFKESINFLKISKTNGRIAIIKDIFPVITKKSEKILAANNLL